MVAVAVVAAKSGEFDQFESLRFIAFVSLLASPVSLSVDHLMTSYDPTAGAEGKTHAYTVTVPHLESEIGTYVPILGFSWGNLIACWRMISDAR